MTLSTSLGASSFDPNLAKYESAQVSALGLTAKQFFTNEQDDKFNTGYHGDNIGGDFDPNLEINVESLPTENVLATLTLWPEINRLYGHPNEIYSLSVSPDGKLVAAACKVCLFHF